MIFRLRALLAAAILIVPFLAGLEYVLPSAADQIPAGAPIQSVHMNSGNQNFLSYQLYNPALANQQIAVMDQLQQVLPPGDAETVQALQQQKTALSGKPGKQP